MTGRDKSRRNVTASDSNQHNVSPYIRLRILRARHRGLSNVLLSIFLDSGKPASSNLRCFFVCLCWNAKVVRGVNSGAMFAAN